MKTFALIFRSFLCLLVTWSYVATSAANADDLNDKVVSSFSNSEFITNMVFNAGKLWIGHTTEGKPRIEIVDSKLTQTKNIALSHSPEYVNSLGPDSIITVGRYLSPEGVVNYAYTTITVGKDGSLKTQLKKLGTLMTVTAVGGTPDDILLADRGFGRIVHYKPFVSKSNEADPEYPMGDEETPELMKTLAVEAPGSSEVNPADLDHGTALAIDIPQLNLIPRVSKFVVKSKTLFALESRVRSVSDSVAQVSLPTGKVKRAFRDLTNISDLFPLDEKFPWVVAGDVSNNRVVLVDPNSNRRKFIPMSEPPRSFSQVGHCLLVLTQKDVTFHDLKADNQVVDRWNFGHHGFFMDSPRFVEADVDAKTVYVGALRPCKYCEAKSNGIIALSQGLNSTFDACLK